MHDLEKQGRKKIPLIPCKEDALRMLAAAAVLLAVPVALQAQSSVNALPDAPSTLLLEAQNAAPGAQQNTSSQNTSPQSTPQQTSPQPSKPPTPLLPADSAPAALLPVPVLPLTPQDIASQAKPVNVLPCPSAKRHRVPLVFLPSTQPTCEDQLQLIVDTGYIKPITPTEKGILAIRVVIDPFNLLTIAAFSGISVAADAHSDYGPGFAGWGRLAGYSLAEDAQSTFTGVYLIPTLAHEDPRYHRMSRATVRRRIEHALVHPFVSQHDDGSLMPNYATLINVPLSAEISNLYVPGIGVNASDTAKRVLVGYGTEPIGPLVAEFLPDFAKRVHIHIVFAQQILNRIALGSNAQAGSF